MVWHTSTPDSLLVGPHCLLASDRSRGPHSMCKDKALEQQHMCMGHNDFTKLPTICLPLSVMMLSGWNCTPCQAPQSLSSLAEVAARRGCMQADRDILIACGYQMAHERGRPFALQVGT